MNFGLDKLVKPLLAGGYKEETSIAIGRNEGGQGRWQNPTSIQLVSKVTSQDLHTNKKKKRKALTGFLFSLSDILRPLERVSTSV